MLLVLLCRRVTSDSGDTSAVAEREEEGGRHYRYYFLYGMSVCVLDVIYTYGRSHPHTVVSMYMYAVQQLTMPICTGKPLNVGHGP